MKYVLVVSESQYIKPLPTKCIKQNINNKFQEHLQTIKSKFMKKYGRYVYSSKSNLSIRGRSGFSLFSLLLSAPCHLKQYRHTGSMRSNV